MSGLAVLILLTDSVPILSQEEQTVVYLPHPAAFVDMVLITKPYTFLFLLEHTMKWGGGAKFVQEGERG